MPIDFSAQNKRKRRRNNKNCLNLKNDKGWGENFENDKRWGL